MRSSRVLMLMAVLVATMTGCASPAPADDGTDAVVRAQVRTDREPIDDRFPELGSFHEVHWLGGTVGDDRVPGPSTYFIDAAVALRPVDADALRRDHLFAAAPGPAVPDQLDPHLPGSGWVSSPELDRGVGPEGWEVHVYLRPDAPVAYLSAIGGN